MIIPQYVEIKAVLYSICGGYAKLAHPKLEVFKRQQVLNL